MKILDSIVTQAAGIAAIRRDIHAHPELCFEEVRTADVVAQKLTEWGIPIHRGLGTTGVVGILKNGSSDRAIGLRADMDALPMQEFNTFSHASKHQGKMHACGHDGHTAMLLAAAQHFAKNRNFDGTVYLIFQPAEEGGGGAREMIKEGLFEQFPMQAVFGMHNWPGSQIGKFAVSPGPVMASSNEFKITIRGKGAHAALPHNGVDPVPVACQMVQAFQTIVSRNLNPLDAGVVTVGSIHGGSASNVIPDSVELKITVRSFRPEVRALLKERIPALARAQAESFGAVAEVDYQWGFPAVVNHAEETQLARQLAQDTFGEALVERDFQPRAASEDFANMLQAKRGSYLFFGNGAGPSLHNPGYDFNDAILAPAASYWTRLAERFLA